METSLHRQLKTVYADEHAQFEVKLGRYRIDVVNQDELVEIQHGSLAAIRSKIRALLPEHRIRVVKPIVVRKRLVKRQGKGKPVVDRRLSPKRGQLLEIFHELIYFRDVFPHPNLVLDVALVDIEEWRYPGHGRRRRRRVNDHQVEDQKLLQVHAVHRFRTAADLLQMITARVPAPFHTQHLAKALTIDRWFAQRIAYCLRETGAIRQVGKERNALLYEFANPRKRTSSSRQRTRSACSA